MVSISVTLHCHCLALTHQSDFNYERQSDSSCQLVAGLSKPDHSAICSTSEDVKEYNDPTGYRRIPLTTCSGGKELDYTSKTHPCPGYEEDYRKKHGIGAAGLFFAIVLPIAAAAGIGWWVYKNWEGKFG
jgi:Sortilin, neurotensin receptor 3, C-terminal